MSRAASQLGAIKAVEKSRNGMARKRRALFSSFSGDESIFFPSSLVKNSPRRICRDAGVPPANGNDLDNDNPFLSDGTQVSVPTSMPFCYYASRSPPKRAGPGCVSRLALRRISFPRERVWNANRF